MVCKFCFSIICFTEHKNLLSYKGICFNSLQLAQFINLLQFACWLSIHFKFSLNTFHVCFKFISDSFHIHLKFVLHSLQICLEICFKFQKQLFVGILQNRWFLKNLQNREENNWVSFSKVASLQPAKKEKKRP